MDFNQDIFPGEDMKSPLSYLLNDATFNNSLFSSAFDLDKQQTPKSSDILDDNMGIDQARESETNKTSENNQDDSANPKPKVRQRRRKPKNCTFCRRRKLKCDRQHPCSNCVKRKIGSTCSYASECGDLPITESTTSLSARDLMQPKIFSPSAKSTSPAVLFSDFSNEKPVENASQASELRTRLDKMEMLVLSMLQDRQSSSNANGSGAATSSNGSSTVNSNSTTIHSNTSPSISSASNHETSNQSSPETDTSPVESVVRQIKPGNENVASIDKARDVLGMLKLDNQGKSVYHGDTHWGSLFSEIDQLEELIHRLKLNNSQSLKEMEASGTSNSCTPLEFPFMNPARSTMTPLDVLATIPSKTICDTLVDRYFEYMQPCFQIFHRPTFQREYDEFWTNPISSELLWVSAFLGMLSVALQSYPDEETPEYFRGKQRKTWKLWIEGAEVCAYQGKIGLKPGLVNVRAVLTWILAQSNVVVCWEWTDAVTISLSILVRMCQAMGLHRDPKWFTISTFEAESRKRIWSVVRYLDMFMSIVQGLPTLISPTGTDVDVPLNVEDKDIMPEYEHSPVDLPLTVRTDTSFTICRMKMMKWSSLILDLSSAVGPHSVKMSYERVLELHSIVRSTYIEAPDYISISVLKGSNQGTPPQVLLQKVWFEIDYLKTILSLHRFHGALGMENLKYRRSREESLSATIRLLQLAEWWYRSPEAVEVKKRFQWIALHIYTAHFLHSTIYLCLALLNHFDTFSVEQRLEQARLVEISQGIFQEVGKHTIHYKAVSQMIAMIIGQIEQISKLSVKDRAVLNEQREQRKASGQDYANTFNLSSEPFIKGLTMKLETSDSIVRFDKIMNLMNNTTPTKPDETTRSVSPEGWPNSTGKDLMDASGFLVQMDPVYSDSLLRKKD